MSQITNVTMSDTVSHRPPEAVPAAAPAVRPGAVLADQLRAKADGLTAKIEHLERPLSQNWTPKRGREYASRQIDADQFRRAQTALRLLAVLHERGECPPLLAGLRSVSAVAALVQHRTDSHGYYDIHSTGEYRDKSPAGVALQELLQNGLTPEQRAQEAARTQAAAVEQAENELRGADIPGFFPTPAALADELIARADIQPGMICLEPSAGTGSLAVRMRERAGQSPLCCERNYMLRNLLALKQLTLTPQFDFLEVPTELQFDRIVMNPPFESGQDIAHVQHAWHCLKPGGRLVAVVSAGTMSRQSNAAESFRAWLDEIGAEVSEPRAGEFTGAEAFRQTGVAVCVILADKS